jgi:DNA modification methylase
MGWQDYRSQHECISYGWKSGAKHYFIDDRSQTTVWEISRDSQNSYIHPTTKPVELAKKGIRNSSVDGDIVVDFFLGSGTTLVACENLKRRCRAIEISPAYVAVALERMAMAFPELKIEKV